MKVTIEVELEEPHREWGIGDEDQPDSAAMAESLVKYLPRIMFNIDGRKSWAVRIKDAVIKPAAVTYLHDGLEYGWNNPAPASKSDLLMTLNEAVGAIEQDDSFEGTITWTMPVASPEDEELADKDWRWAKADFGMLARFRVGNSMGQGGIRAFTTPVTVPPEPAEA